MIKKYLIIFLAGAIIFAVGSWAVKSWLNNSPQYRFGADRAAVIKQIQSLSRMETASFSIDKIIEIGTNYDSLKQFLFGDKLLLVANGKVIAGFDLSRLQSQDFSGSGNSITIRLPAPQILSVILDNAETKVFDRRQGVLTKGDIDLEAAARQQAETAIRSAACQGKILKEASKNAEEQIKIIFKSSGFNNVTVIIPDATCT